MDMWTRQFILADASLFVPRRDLRIRKPTSTLPKLPSLQFDGRSTYPFAALPPAPSSRKHPNGRSSTKKSAVYNLNHKQLDFLLFHQMLEPVDPSTLCFHQPHIISFFGPFPLLESGKVSILQAAGTDVDDPLAFEEDDTSSAVSSSSRTYQSTEEAEEEVLDAELPKETKVQTG